MTIRQLETLILHHVFCFPSALTRNNTPLIARRIAHNVGVYDRVCCMDRARTVQFFDAAERRRLQLARDTIAIQRRLYIGALFELH